MLLEKMSYLLEGVARHRAQNEVFVLRRSERTILVLVVFVFIVGALATLTALAGFGCDRWRGLRCGGDVVLLDPGQTRVRAVDVAKRRVVLPVVVAVREGP